MFYRHPLAFLAPFAVVAAATVWKVYSAAPRVPKKRATPKQQSLIRQQDFERHSVVTHDGVTLNLLRLVRSGKREWMRSKKVVLLIHGLFDSSETWLLNGPTFSLPYLLADAEWDVWIADTRGNTYSPIGNGDYTWDEMAHNDVPAFVRHIKTSTGATSVALVGHSQGAVEILAALAERALSPRDVSGVALLAPPAIMKNHQSQLLGTLASMRVDRALKHIPDSMFRSTLTFLRRVVGTTGLKYDATFRFMFGRTKFLEGSNYHGHFPAPTSVKNVCHWIQMSRSGRFQHYSGSSSKVYDLNQLPHLVKMATFSGTNDLLATPRDIASLNEQLKATSNLTHTETFEGYAHMDFTWSLDAIRTVYPSVLRFLNSACVTRSTRRRRSWLRMPQEKGQKGQYLERDLRSSEYRSFTDSFRGR